MAARLFFWSRLVLVGACLGVGVLGDRAMGATALIPPRLEPRREFRGVWVATVKNIDWPSKPGLGVAEQQREWLALVDQAQALKLNAIILQVRPGCDALYPSKLEPWSAWLSGRMGVAPSPAYDPLAFAIKTAHERGLELHAWFNPFRAGLLNAAGQLDAVDSRHVSVTHPQWVRRYGSHLWLDPGESAAQAHSLAVIEDVVRRYPVDGVHIDDYFYPYPETLQGGSGKKLPFPDDITYERYAKQGGNLVRADWRRENVNRFVETLYRRVKQVRPAVKVGISPFGIWRPRYPAQIVGMDQYEEIYADPRLWLHKGWLDYLAPQLYWSIENPDQSFPVLLDWWREQNVHGRHIWPGLFTSRVRDTGPAAFDARQIDYQIRWTRLKVPDAGHIHFSARAFLEKAGGLNERLQTQVYAEPALVPASDWLGGAPVPRPHASVTRRLFDNTTEVSWRIDEPARARWWVVQRLRQGRWQTDIQPALNNRVILEESTMPQILVLTGVNPLGQMGNPLSIRFQFEKVDGAKTHLNYQMEP